MIITYISKNWNFEKTSDVSNIPDFLERIDWLWFEKRENTAKTEKTKASSITKIKSKAQEVEEEQTPIEHKKKADLKLEKANFDEKDAIRARNFCKEHKVLRYWLLKGQKIIDLAVKNGFVI